MVKWNKKSSHLATTSLAIMGVGFVATIPIQHNLWGGILQGGFESGLVGGLADWFAVTALFRHPLGIPIPHTALLPKNRKRITSTIISMLENDWLTKESIREKIAGVHFTDKVVALAEKEIHSNGLKNTVVSMILKAIDHIDIKHFTPIVENEIKSQIHSIEIDKLLPFVVEQFTARKYDEKALDFILNEIDEWANKDSTKDRLGNMAIQAIENIQVEGFMQFALKSFSSLVNEEKLGNIIQSLIQKGVNSFRDPFNQNRQTLLWNIETKLQYLKNGEKVILELEDLKTQMVDEWSLEGKVYDFLQSLKEKMVFFVNHPNFYDQYVLPFITSTLTDLKQDLNKMSNIEEWIRKHIYQFIEHNHSRVGKLVEENLDKLDDKTLIDMLETNVGKDLQWIRVNGAICGFLIGLILVGIRTFL
ncbi:MAG: DUF445 domain-containing protein [Bacillota bacterium]|nr:DUF445 domain-containing protein [Bacillota bacterium]